MEVVINEIPYPTEKFFRIGYTLRTWEFEKEGLTLEKIVVLDNQTKAALFTIEKSDLPDIYKDPIPPFPFLTWDKLNHCYLSIQLPLPLDQAYPTTLSHRFEFRDTLQNLPMVYEGAIFSPRLSESPVRISSPVKGEMMLLENQSTRGLHFRILLFTGGKLWRPERFAFDSRKYNEEFKFYEGDPKVNESYFNYGDTLYAVADGVVVTLVDGLPENHGDAMNVVFYSFIEFAGNYLVLDIGGGHFAGYAHIVPNSFLVQAGDQVKEGDPVALLGNSGNSTDPHLHFQITDGPDFIYSNGVTFVLKRYIKIGDPVIGPIPPTEYTNAMMEETSMLIIE
ncbi:MAG: M23 family metallopeptidase [bacterium]